MKKVLIGVGVGCGVLVLVGIVAVVSGGLWVKGKVNGMAQDGERLQKQEQQVASLNQKYAFQEPPKGQPLPLSEARLEDYFVVRKALAEVVTAHQQKMKQLEGTQANPTQALGALNTLMGMMGEVRGRWLELLEQQKMSPREFHAITAALYSSGLSKARGKLRQNQRAALEQVKQKLEAEAKDESLPAAKRENLRRHLAMIEKQLSMLPAAPAVSSETDKIHEANAALYAKYKAQIEAGVNPALDSLLLGDSAAMGTAFQDAMGQDSLPELPTQGASPADEAPTE